MSKDLAAMCLRIWRLCLRIWRLCVYVAGDCISVGYVSKLGSGDYVSNHLVTMCLTIW